MSLLLCFSGEIGSGKTSVSKQVASALDWTCVGFGDYLRSEIQRKGGDPTSREELQTLGQERVKSNPRKFCEDVLASGDYTPGDDFVIDGIRHVEIFNILTEIVAPSRAKLLYLDSKEKVRLSRINDKDDVQDFARASDHPVEAELGDKLPRCADGVIDANKPLKQVVEDCLKLVEHWSKELSGN
jgi:dephospho-CoA kinase